MFRKPDVFAMYDRKGWPFGCPFFLNLRGVIREVYWLYRLYGLCGYMVMCCMGVLCVLG
jgi:hypothetical protein